MSKAALRSGTGVCRGEENIGDFDKGGFGGKGGRSGKGGRCSEGGEEGEEELLSVAVRELLIWEILLFFARRKELQGAGVPVGAVNEG